MKGSSATTPTMVNAVGWPGHHGASRSISAASEASSGATTTYVGATGGTNTSFVVNSLTNGQLSYFTVAAVTVARRVPADEPIGVCFSGGVDSGAVFVTVYEVMRQLGLRDVKDVTGGFAA